MYRRYLAFVLLALVGAVSFSFFDLQISENLLARLDPVHIQIAEIVTKIGDGKPFVVLVMLMVIMGEFLTRKPIRQEWIDSRALRHYGYFCAIALLITGVTVLTLKWGIGRSRPDLWFDAQVFGFLPFSLESAYDYKSFPSGHSQTAFTVAFLLSCVLPSRAKFLLFLLAGCVAFSRVVLSEHWLADVIFGSLIGYGIPAYLYYHAGRPDFKLLRFRNPRTA